MNFNYNQYNDVLRTINGIDSHLPSSGTNTSWESRFPDLVFDIQTFGFLWKSEGILSFMSFLLYRE